MQDAITKGNWTFNLGLRGDFYNGLSTSEWPNRAWAWRTTSSATGTVLQASYARIMETPFNENLVLSSIGCGNPVLNPLLWLLWQRPQIRSVPGGATNTTPDFSRHLANTLCFPASTSGSTRMTRTTSAYWEAPPLPSRSSGTKSKIPGVAGRVSLANYHGFTAFMVFSSVAARFFAPQVAGAGATPSAPGGVFRIDHDEKFNQTTHMQYQPWKNGPWMGFNWRYDSGLVAGPVPCAGGNCANGPAGSDSVVDVSNLTPDQQFQAGLFCGSGPCTAASRIQSEFPSAPVWERTLPRLAIRLNAGLHSSPRNRKRRPQSSAHRPRNLVRSSRWRRQPLPRRQI